MGHKLLLADDSVTIQRVIELTFADEDIEVIPVGDGQQAITRIQADKPDIVLADVGMPERNGYDVAAFIKQTPELKHIPVVLLTGAFEPVDEARARAVGSDGVLVKPFEPQMVINRVKDLLAGKRPPELWARPPGQPTPVAPMPPGASAPAGPASPAAPPVVGDREPQAQAAGTEALDDYFDRLDDAFVNLTRPSPADTELASGVTSDFAADVDRLRQQTDREVTTTADASLDRWDPSLETSPGVGVPPSPPASPAPDAVDTWLNEFSQSLAGEERVPPPTPAPTAALRPASVAPGAQPGPSAQPPSSLSEAFAALLSGEQQSAPPPERGVGPVPAIDDRVIDSIVNRVITRLTDRVVRESVLEVAERLVREEIARIKGVAR